MPQSQAALVLSAAAPADRVRVTCQSIALSHVQVGLRIAYNAAFNVQKAPSVWDDFARKEGPGSEALALLSTHPPSLKRKKALQAELASAPYW